jgi:hypothetical protein
MDPKQTVQNVINDSALLADEKQTLASAFLENIPEAELPEFAELLKSHPWIVPVLHVNLVSKMLAISRRDSDMLNKILESEEKLLDLIDEVEKTRSHSTAA